MTYLHENSGLSSAKILGLTPIHVTLKKHPYSTRISACPKAAVEVSMEPHSDSELSLSDSENELDHSAS